MESAAGAPYTRVASSEAATEIGGWGECAAAISRVVTTATAAPSSGVQIMNCRSGSATIGLASTCSGVTSFWYQALGFKAPCFLFFTATRTRVSTVRPCSAM